MSVSSASAAVEQNGKRLRILQLGPLPPPPGGMASVVENLTDALRHEADVRVLNNVKTTPVGRTLWDGIKSQLCLLSRYWTLLRNWKPDVVHIHTCSGFSFWRNGLDVLLARAAGLKVALHVHGGRFHLFLAGMGRAKACVARLILHRAERVIVLGKVWDARLAPWCGSGRIVILENGVRIPSDAKSVRSAGGLHLLCVAGYGRGKGLEDLIRAFAALPQIRPMRLTVVGPELERGYKDSLSAIAAELGVAAQVFLEGPVAPQDVGRFYREADVFCLPSYDEGLPMSMLEAMSFRLPVVATPVGAIPEVIVDGVQGLMHAPGDIARLVECLLWLDGHRDDATAMGERGYQCVLDYYSLDRVASKLLKVYQGMCYRPADVA